MWSRNLLGHIKPSHVESFQILLNEVSCGTQSREGDADAGIHTNPVSSAIGWVQGIAPEILASTSTWFDLGLTWSRAAGASVVTYPPLEEVRRPRIKDQWGFLSIEEVPRQDASLELSVKVLEAKNVEWDPPLCVAPQVTISHLKFNKTKNILKFSQ